MKSSRRGQNAAPKKARWSRTQKIEAQRAQVRKQVRSGSGDDRPARSDRRDDNRGYDNTKRNDNRGGYQGRDDNRGGYNRGERRDDNRGGYQGRDSNRGGYQGRDDNRGGYNRGERRDDNRGGYQGRDSNRGGYQGRDDSRGAYNRGERRDDSRGGYQRRDDRGGRDDNRGGYNRGERRDDRGGYQRRDDNRGGYNRGERRDDNRGGYQRRDDRGGYNRDDRAPRRTDRRYDSDLHRSDRYRGDRNEAPRREREERYERPTAEAATDAPETSATETATHNVAADQVAQHGVSDTANHSVTDAAPETGNATEGSSAAETDNAAPSDQSGAPFEAAAPATAGTDETADRAHQSNDADARTVSDANDSDSNDADANNSNDVDVENLTFADLGLPDVIVERLARDGITTPFPIQAATIPDAMAGRDVLGRGRTGSGKTMSFGLPTLARLAAGGKARPHQPRAIVLAPTRELAMQVSDALLPLVHVVGLRHKLVAGGMPYEPQLQALQRGVDLLVATPGRLQDLMARGAADLSRVEIAILDEADHMAEMGFLEPITEILDAVPEGGQRLLFSATLDRGIDGVVERYLVDPVTHSTDDSTASVTTMQHHALLIDPQNKKAVTAEVANRSGRTVVFCRTKLGADRVAAELRDQGVLAAALHGGLNQGQRNKVLGAFRDGKLPVLVATDVAARGIHVDDVGVVLQIDPPADHKDYLHRAGRTARAGESGTVVTLALPHQRRTVQRLLDQAGVDTRLQRAQPGDDVIAQAGGSTPTGGPITDDDLYRLLTPQRRGGGPRRGGYGGGGRQGGGYRGQGGGGRQGGGYRGQGGGGRQGGGGYRGQGGGRPSRGSRDGY